MEEKKFEKPEAIVIAFTEDDIITNSNFDEYGGEGGMGGE